jgi:uncharacterized NAD(P)/FAD-binding protein YdhS
MCERESHDVTPSRSLPGAPLRRVAIVGGGCAGSLTAVALLRAATTSLEVVLIDRTGTFGPGLAYSTRDDQHLLNVPTARLTAVSAQPDGFLAWARARGEACEPVGFLPRRLFGEYLEQTLAKAAREAELRVGATLRRQAGEVVEVARTHDAECARLADGTSIEVEAVVLALGNRAATLPDGVPDVPGVFASPWEPEALETPAARSVVLLIGSGLTAIDAALTLAAAEPRCGVVAVSRGGQLPFAHLSGPLREPAPPPHWPRRPLSVSDLYRMITAHSQTVGAEGYNWRDVVDGIRPHVPALWQRLGFEQQQRFLRDMMRVWEVRRHRMAPAVAARLTKLRNEKRFDLVAGSVRAVRPAEGGGGGFDVEVALTGAPESIELNVARIISCIGPDMRIGRTADPLLRSLFDRGRASTDAHGIGLRATPDGELLGADGEVQPRLFTLGSLRRGELWETTAVTEIRCQAERIAEVLAASAGPRPAASAPEPVAAAGS